MKHWFRPRTLRGRFVLLMLVGVLGAQVTSYGLWSWQADRERMTQLDTVSRNLAESLAATVRYFRSLPYEYRHIVLDQLRDMGGTRFFVSVNDHRIPIERTHGGRARELVARNLRDGLTRELGRLELHIGFSRPADLRVFNNEVPLNELPAHWAHRSLAMAPLSTPILVIQMPLEGRHWLFVATTLPIAGLLDEPAWFSGDRLFVSLAVLITVIGLSLLGIRWLTRPLSVLARAARRLGDDLESPPLAERGPRELRDTAIAFNRMSERIRHQVDERERLFSAISHDLKTPITRLRLRAEMLDDVDQREAFVRALDEMDQLVKGALASVKGLDLHEQAVTVDVDALLEDLVAELAVYDTPLRRDGRAGEIVAKPLALKRCLANLIENAIFYGQRVEIACRRHANQLVVTICDDGPGIPEAQRERVFQPFVRLEPSRSRHTGGSGLGLAIARHIARAHGGDIQLGAAPGGGLAVRLSLALGGNLGATERNITSL
ncbi:MULTISPECIES: ATP-binding protein [unclassified Modicisalibacter]|uniref:ATP-binding protein n=1 Tax=unclassified Modicisalibacter TaxID=2679913 RepID=UPI001CCE7AEB|nr:HAMP domain-containing protein [Modicisalibacter sp. R2A 31.J]MBZ9574800.1 HAMP domain-containing protein [Modicisalibacter sp. MOD 31.J]